MFKDIPGGKEAGCFKENSSVWLAISVSSLQEGHSQWDKLTQRLPREGEPGPTVWILLHGEVGVYSLGRIDSSALFSTSVK